VEQRRAPGALVVTGSRDYAAELAFYLPDHPQTYTLWQGSYRSQYDLWDGLCKQIGKEALVVTKGWPNQKALAPCLKGIKSLGSWEKTLVGGRNHLRASFFSGRLKPCAFLGPRCQRKDTTSP